MKKGTRLIFKDGDMEIIYLGRNKKKQELFKGVVVVKGDGFYPVGHYSKTWVLEYFEIKK